MSRFTEILGQEPAIWEPSKPDATRIAATGRALPSGAHTLTAAQQQAWFGGVVFDAPVEWDGEAFVSGDVRLTPAQVAERAGS